MDKIESFSLKSARTDELHDFVLVLAVAAVETVRHGARLAGNEKFPTHARLSRGSNGGIYATRRDFALQSPEHLLGAPGAVLGDGKKRVRNVKNPVKNRVIR
jgi:hypothetical protein